MSNSAEMPCILFLNRSTKLGKIKKNQSVKNKNTQCL